MKKIKYLLLILILVPFGQSCKNDFNTRPEVSIIPAPETIRQFSKPFVIDPETKIIISEDVDDLAETASTLKGYIFESSGLDLEILLYAEAEGLENVILISTIVDENRMGAEGYRLGVDMNKVVISAKDGNGAFYGVQSLKQIFDFQQDNSKGKLLIPDIQIWDEPRFSYRGMHLDVCRHFFDVDFLKHYLDLMAYYKFNTFHWHLTEDQAWRIEIKKYPKLTDIGAWRTEKDGSNYGGYYTQEEIKEVVAYAKKLHITIIPEIEMPGHSRAALSAYPELSCTGKQQEVPNSWGVFEDIYCAGNDRTFEFIQNVLDEVIPLFPGEYIHIGGDEAPKERWEKCKKCQARMRKEGLKNEHELQSYFIKRIDTYLTSKGKKLMGWDEIIEGGLAENATVMSWRGMEGGIAAARLGNKVVMTPGSHCYFDHYQADKEFEPKAIGGFTSLKKVYDFEPVPEDLFTEQKTLILGAQGNVWTEYMKDTDYVEYMILPRMLALSEVLWTSKKSKSWSSFQRRLQNHFLLFDKKGYRYSKGSYQLDFEISFDSTLNQKEISISSEQFKPEIFYTLDGSIPTDSSMRYERAIKLKEKDSLLTAAIFEDGKMMQSSSRKNLK